MSVNPRDNEAGFTMIMTVIGLSLMAMLVLVAVTAVNGDSHLTAYDLQQKQAYEAARAGIDDYSYHLHANNSYWTSCDKVNGPTAVNLQKSQKNWRYVPGSTTAKYAIELLPATGQTKYTDCSTANPTGSMLEAKDPLKGTFRIRSTGYDGKAKVSIVATFKPASFLDYVYFTELETSDPVTYPEALISSANTQCSKTIRDGRYNAEIAAGKGYCDVIVFAAGDHINGPMHTNDAFVVCGSPTLGRDAADPIEVSSPPTGWYPASKLQTGGCSGDNKNFVGTFTANSPVLTPPPTNDELQKIAFPEFRFRGQYRACLSGTNITIMHLTEAGTCEKPASTVYSGAIPANGVIYFESWECNGSYTPFNPSYKIAVPQSECGEVYVQGEYSGQLTIGADNNIVITNNLCTAPCKKETPFKGFKSSAMLGLVANNFVRIYHPVKNWSLTGNPNEPHKCENATGTLANVVIDAAILAIKHSFIVDNYDCGAKLGEISLHGALAQKYRGAVGKAGTRGYTKDYNYDNRLRYQEPPSFIAPEKSAWVIGRETVDN